VNEAAEEMLAVIDEQRQEIEYLQNVLERLTAYRPAEMHGLLYLFEFIPSCHFVSDMA